MAKKNPKQAGFDETAPGAGFESPGRIPELHAIWLEIVELQDAVGEAREALKAKQEQARAELHRRGLDHYKVDGADLWAEPQPDRIKAKKPGGRKKGKIVKVVAGDDEGPPAVDAGVRDRRDAAAAEDETEN